MQSRLRWESPHDEAGLVLLAVPPQFERTAQIGIHEKATGGQTSRGWTDCRDSRRYWPRTIWFCVGGVSSSWCSRELA